MSDQFQLACDQAVAYDSSTSLFMVGSARLLAEGAGIHACDVVLDLACGTGLVARQVAPLVAPGGMVIGADINPAMLAVAGRRPDVGISWIQAPCDALPLEDGTFTHVICQQGFQFFPDPVAAASEARRVLRPGGSLIATVWATPGRNPYIEHQLDLLAALDPTLTVSVARATPARADEFLRSIASSAGFGDVEVTLLEHVAEVADFVPWFEMQTGGTPWGPALTSVGDERRHELSTAMAERMQPYAAPDGTHRIPFCSYRLSARAPT